MKLKIEKPSDKSELIARIKENTDLYLKLIMTKGRKRLKIMDLAMIIASSTPVIIDNQSTLSKLTGNSNLTNFSETSKYYIYEPALGIYINSIPYMKKLISFINQGIDIANGKDEFDISKTAYLVDDYMSNMDIVDGIEEYKPVPDHLIKLNNGVYNKQTHSLEKDTDDYHFLNASPFNYISKENRDQSSLDRFNLILNGWTGKDESKKDLLKQIFVSVIDSDGRKSWIIVYGQGGNGKSSMINLARAFAGQSTVSMNLHEIYDDNTLNQLNDDTKLVYGDDLQDNFKLQGVGLARFKQITEGTKIQTNVKFKENYMAGSKCTKLQATNMYPGFSENNNAVADRLILFSFTDKNFRQETPLDFALESVIGNPDLGIAPNYDFICNILSYLLDEFSSFTKFNETLEMKEFKRDHLNELDVVENFVIDMEAEGLFELPYITTDAMYQLFLNWDKQINPSKRNHLSFKSFSSTMKNKYKRIGFSSTKDRVKLKKVKGVTLSLINSLADLREPIVDDNRSHVLKNENFKKISEQELDDTLTAMSKEIDGSLLTNRQKYILYYKALVDNDLTFASILPED